MAKKRTSDNIWTNAFKGREIEGTNVRNGQKSMVSLSRINTTGKATIAYSPTQALMMLIKGKCSIAQKDNVIWAECKSKNIAGRKYVVWYDTAKKEVKYFGTQNKQRDPSIEIVTPTFTHWSVFVPWIIEIILDKPQGEFAQRFRDIKEVYEQHNRVSTNNELFVLNDYLYESRHEYVMRRDEVVQADTIIFDYEEDLTASLFQRQGEFDFAQPLHLVSSPANSSNTATKKETKKKTSSSSKTKSANEFDLGHKLTEEEKKLVPNLDLRVTKIPVTITKLARMVKEEHETDYPVNNLLLYGEAGAGKSTAAQILAQLFGLPYRFINLSLNSEESELIGTYRPKADGTFEFFEPAFAETFRNGGVIELMEINYARPGALGVLNSALDATARITLGNSEVVERHPNCIIIATTNVDYAGCQKMNEALKDRFHVMCEIEKLSDRDLIDITMQGSGNQDKALVTKMVDAVNKISTKMKEEQILGGVCSTRQLINWARHVKYTQDPIESAKNTILPGVSLDGEIQKEIIDTILKPMF